MLHQVHVVGYDKGEESSSGTAALRRSCAGGGWWFIWGFTVGKRNSISVFPSVGMIGGVNGAEEREREREGCAFPSQCAPIYRPPSRKSSTFDFRRGPIVYIWKEREWAKYLSPHDLRSTHTFASSSLTHKVFFSIKKKNSPSNIFYAQWKAIVNF